MRQEGGREDGKNEGRRMKAGKEGGSGQLTWRVLAGGVLLCCDDEAAFCRAILALVGDGARMVGWLAGWLVGWLVGLLVDVG